ncbi:MAG: hypothetical protein CM1200mP14_14680 [Gammaproteobacteria bacterium]|nr:MAG: hypothetical protein CM1200mP14_14680 [Gammaproteobacteria bacterium]
MADPISDEDTQPMLSGGLMTKGLRLNAGRMMFLVGIIIGFSASPVKLEHRFTPRTRLVLLGTGTPNADPERSGPATAVVVDDRAYLIDAGPGVVRRAALAAREKNMPALLASGLNHVFITHLHFPSYCWSSRFALQPLGARSSGSSKCFWTSRNTADDEWHCVSLG